MYGASWGELKEFCGFGAPQRKKPISAADSIGTLLSQAPLLGSAFVPVLFFPSPWTTITTPHPFHLELCSLVCELFFVSLQASVRVSFFFLLNFTIFHRQDGRFP